MQYKFIGWCRDRDHDKVWGVIYLEDYSQIPYYPSHAKCLVFWGRRGGKLQTKLDQDDRTLKKLIDSKIQKGYKEIKSGKLSEIYPEFENDLEKTAVYSILKI